MLSPDFFTSEHALKVSLPARYLFAGLWCLADRLGILEDRPVSIKIALLPMEPVDVKALLDELAGAMDDDGAPLIYRYRHEETRKNLIWIPGFGKRQKPHPNEASSTFSLPGQTMDWMGPYLDQFKERRKTRHGEKEDAPWSEARSTMEVSSNAESESESESESDSKSESVEESPLTPQGEDLDPEEIDPNEPEWMRSKPPPAAARPPPAKVEPPAPAPSTQQPGGEEPSPDKPEVVASPTAATQEARELLDEWNRIARIHGMPVSRDCRGRREEITKALRRPETRERWRELFSIIDQEGGTPPGWTNALNLTTVLRPVSLPKILDRQWWARGKPRADQMGSIQVAQKIGKVFDEYKAREQQRETQEHERRLEITDGNE
jgi:hypothetical protein